MTDSKGRPVPNVTVAWHGDGEVFASATSSSATGIIRNRWTLGIVAGVQKMEARWIDPKTGETKVLGTFTATADPGPAVTLEVVPDTLAFLNNSIAGSALVRKAVDQYGNPITRAPELSTSSEGFAVSGGSLALPSEEKTGSVSVSVGGLTRTVNTTAVVDLRKLDLRMDLSCTGGGRHWDWEGEMVKVDSIVFEDEAIDSAYYRGDAGFADAARSTSDRAVFIWSPKGRYFLPVPPSFTIWEDGRRRSGSKHRNPSPGSCLATILTEEHRPRQAEIRGVGRTVRPVSASSSLAPPHSDSCFVKCRSQNT